MKERNIFLTGCVVLLSLLSITVGCLNKGTQSQFSTVKPPVFHLINFIGVWDFLPSEAENATNGSIRFAITVENPNNNTVQLTVLYLHVLDQSGTELLSFTSKDGSQDNFSNQSSRDKIILEEGENVSRTFINRIYSFVFL